MYLNDDNLGIEQANDPLGVIQYHAAEGNIALEDFDIKEAQQVIQPDNGELCTRPSYQRCPSREHGRCTDEITCPPLQVN
jgi:hypothetical protein